MLQEDLFKKTEGYIYPSTIVFRAIEFRFLLERFDKYLKMRPAIDLGCGDGIAAEIVFEGKIEYGLDIDSLAIEEAKKRRVYDKTFVSGASEIPLADGSVRLVFSNSSMEHMPDLKGVLAEAARICKKGGYLVFTVPTNNLKRYGVFSFLGFKRLAGVYGRLRDKRLDHFHCHMLGWWKKELKKYGFEVVDSCYYLDKKTIEYWDALSILHKLTGWVRSYFPSVMPWIYIKFLRKGVYEGYRKAKVVGRGGAAVCVVAKKI
jgi:SAM-dependent methyltransferase